MPGVGQSAQYAIRRSLLVNHAESLLVLLPTDLHCLGWLLRGAVGVGLAVIAVGRTTGGNDAMNTLGVGSFLVCCGACLLGAGSLPTRPMPAASLPGEAVPELQMHVVVRDESKIVFDSGVFSLSPYGGADPPYFEYNPGGASELSNTDTFSVAGNIRSQPESSDFPLVLGTSVEFANDSQTTLEFRVSFLMPAASETSVDWAATSSWTLSGAISGHAPYSLSTLPGESLWTVNTDGGMVDSQLIHPSGITTSGSPVVLSAAPFFTESGPIATDVGLELMFQLSPGAQTRIDGSVLGTPRAPEPPCPADVTADTVVDTDDLLAIFSQWGSCAEPCDIDSCTADIDGTCLVDVDDMLEVLLAWGSCK